MKRSAQGRTLNLLLSGEHPRIKKYAGKHVFVAGAEVAPMKKGLLAWQDFERLKKKYKRPPTLLFVPRPDISYILKC